MSDENFVNHPLRKLINRENIFTRVDRLENRSGATPSARSVQLGQVSQQTGNLVVDGSIIVPNLTDGIADVTINDNGITIRNQQGAFFFDPIVAGSGNIGLYSDGGDFLVLENSVGGKGILFLIDDAAHSVKGMDFSAEGIVMDAGMRVYTEGSTDTPIADSGTYTPNIDASTNVAASSIPGAWSYMRILNNVHISGAVVIDPTAAAATSISFSVPIASDFTTAFQASGIGSQQNSNTNGSIASDATNDNISMSFQATDTASRTWRIMATYQVV